jgi:flagellar biosynthesis/type III secretory pathway chaperone
LKVAGFSNLEFTVNRPENKVHLTADYTIDIGKVKYKIQFEVETELQATSQRSIEKLCRLMLEKLVLFQTLKSAEQKKFALENGYVIA